MSFIDCLNNNTGLMNLIFAGIVALSTICYVYLTFRLFKENKRVRIIQTEPHIIISLKPHKEYLNIIELHIINIGYGYAKNITFKIIKDFRFKNSTLISDMGFFINGIKYLDSKENVSFYLTSAAENFEEKLKIEIEIETKYQNIYNECKTEIFILKLKDLTGLLQLEHTPLNKIAEILENIYSGMNNSRKTD